MISQLFHLILNAAKAVSSLPVVRAQVNSCEPVKTLHLLIVLQLKLKLPIPTDLAVLTVSRLLALLIRNELA
jgi:hypothetical protein